MGRGRALGIGRGHCGYGEGFWGRRSGEDLWKGLVRYFLMRRR